MQPLPFKQAGQASLFRDLFVVYDTVHATMIELLRSGRLGAATLSVSETTAYVKTLLEDDPTLSDCWVRGEISDARVYPSGHTYFTLRDATSQLKCVLFRQHARGLPPLENGRQYAVRGGISIYDEKGIYQLYVTDHRPLGIGELYQQFEQLKSRLEAEGLFAPERKRPLPRWPRRIGIATSAQGAVLHDLRHVIGRRFPLAELVLAPCQVQGAQAVRTVVASLAALNAAGVDVIVIARGGGSIEDLWAFNDEAVARAIATSSVTVVSAIGHETDFTIADFVADLRAPTPSAAGELMVPDVTELARQIDALAKRAHRAMRLRSLDEQSRFVDLEVSLRHAMARRLDQAHGRLAALEGRLRALGPLSVLARGYAVVRDAASRRVVKSARTIRPGQHLAVMLVDGQFDASVASVASAATSAGTLEAGRSDLVEVKCVDRGDGGRAHE